MNLFLLLLVALVSYAVSLFLARRRFSLFQDQPGDRSLHETATPRSGGLAICTALFLGGLLIFREIADLLAPSSLLALALLVGLALLDDIRSLPPVFRFFVQAISAVLLVYASGFAWTPLDSGQGLPTYLFQLLSVLVFLWSINLYNFMDGMDGFASGMALWGFSGLALLGYLSGDMTYCLFNALIVAAVSGFWVLNFPPARIFMGDSGSTLLGALMALCSIAGIERDLFAVWTPLILFAPFWVDATYTLIRRMLRREKFWLPHRSHFYQRLALAGLGHRCTVLWEYLLMFFGGFSVVCMKMLDMGYTILIPAGFLLFYGVLCIWLERWLQAGKHRQ